MWTLTASSCAIGTTGTLPVCLRVCCRGVLPVTSLFVVAGVPQAKDAVFFANAVGA